VDRRLKASTLVEVQVDGRGRSQASVLRCEAPLLVRVAAEPGDGLALVMVGGAAGPLGGDHLQLRLHVGAGAVVSVRSVGATMVQPGPTDASSTMDVHATVAAGGHLDWRPEPTVSVVGSDHRCTTTIELGTGATLRWVDELSLGRHGELPGRLGLRQRLEIGGRVVLDHDTEFGTAALRGPGAHGSGRCVLSGLIVGDDAPARAAAVVDPRLVRGVFPIEPGVALVTCVADSRHGQRCGLTV
jgi:urease accessory protein